MPMFRKLSDVGPIADPSPPDKLRLRQMIGASMHERIVFMAFGGIPFSSLPFLRMEAMKQYRFVVSGAVPDGLDRTVSDASIPLPFRTVMASADLILSKPGYSTVVEAVATGTPMVYVRRNNFPDEVILADYLHRYGRGIELAGMDFYAGRWEDAFDAVSTLSPPSHPPPPSGATAAAEMITGYLRG
jgi:hypothetical protein